MQYISKDINYRKQPRSSNLELYRIIVMFLIICHHYVVNSGLMTVMGGANALNAASVFYYIFGAWGKTGINCFVLITGYFMCASSISLRKFLKLYLQIVFYFALFYAVFCISGYQSFSTLEFLKLFISFRHIISDSFVSAYMVWWLFIPFLNAIVNNITRRQHQLLLCLCVGVFTFYPYLPDFQISVNPICWFSTIYFIASYIRLYPETIFHSQSAKIWGIATFLSLVIGIASIVGILYFNAVNGKQLTPYWLVSDSNAPIALLLSVTSFMLFKNLKIDYNKTINAIGATTFGVLLIHANCSSMRQWLWRDTIDCIGHYDVDLYWLYAIGMCLCVFLICSAIDAIRIKYLENKAIDFAEQCINKLHK